MLVVLAHDESRSYATVSEEEPMLHLFDVEKRLSSRGQGFLYVGSLRFTVLGVAHAMSWMPEFNREDVCW